MNTFKIYDRRPLGANGFRDPRPFAEGHMPILVECTVRGDDGLLLGTFVIDTRRGIIVEEKPAHNYYHFDNLLRENIKAIIVKNLDIPIYVTREYAGEHLVFSGTLAPESGYHEPGEEIIVNVYEAESFPRMEIDSFLVAVGRPVREYYEYEIPKPLPGNIVRDGVEYTFSRLPAADEAERWRKAHFPLPEDRMEKLKRGLQSGIVGVHIRDEDGTWITVSEEAISSLNEDDLYFSCVVFGDGSHLPIPLVAEPPDTCQGDLIKKNLQLFLSNNGVRIAVERYLKLAIL